MTRLTTIAALLLAFGCAPPDAKDAPGTIDTDTDVDTGTGTPGVCNNTDPVDATTALCTIVYEMTVDNVLLTHFAGCGALDVITTGPVLGSSPGDWVDTSGIECALILDGGSTVFDGCTLGNCWHVLLCTFSADPADQCLLYQLNM